MRVCKCGGVVRQHQLVNNREALTCSSCGRYEVVEVRFKEEFKELGLLRFETGKVSDIKGE
jgi:hypothetical protein